MKKTLLICCVLLMTLMVSAVAEDMDFGIWKLSHYVDEFKLPTDEAYITNSAPIEGTFCNSAVDDALLNVSILMDEYDFAFVLYEYGSSKVKNSFSGARYYEITMLDDNREKTYLTGKMSADGGDRIILGDDAENTVLRALENNASLSFYIAETDNPTTNYLFTIGDTDGIGAAIMALETSFNERDYQAAVKLYNAGNYKEALRIFAALDNYKDSGEWKGKYQAMKYAEAEELLAAKKYAAANEAFIEAGDYSDAKSRVGEPYYVQAEELLAAKDYAGANDAFINAGSYNGAKQRIGEPYYVQAEELLAINDYVGAVSAFKNAGNFEDAAIRVSALRYQRAESIEAAGKKAAAAIAFYELSDYKDARQRSKSLWEEALPYRHISAGPSHSIIANDDGSVRLVGGTEFGLSNTLVQNWKDIIAVSAGDEHTIGLKNDGTVVAAGLNDVRQCNVDSWRNVVAISAGFYHTVGLKNDGTVVATGYSDDARCAVNQWKNIIFVDAGYHHTVGLKADGTVIAVGNNEYGQCDVTAWKDIIAVKAGAFFTVGLKADGTVVATGDNYQGQCAVDDWENIVSIGAGSYHTIGVKVDGTVLAVGDNTYEACNVDDWKDIETVIVGGWHTIGVKKDGTLVAVGYNDDNRCDMDLLLGKAAEILYTALEKGSKGDDVKTLQQALIDQGYLSGKADGDFGNKTVQAVKAAQKAFGMEETGIADDAFQKKLYEAN